MRRAVSAIFLSLGACGTLGGGDGGSENLPNRGIAPYSVIGPLISDARSPSAVVAGDGSVRLFFEQGGAVRAVSGDGERFGAATTVIEDGRSPGAVLGDDGVVRIAYVDAGGDVVVEREDRLGGALLRIEGDGHALADPSLLAESSGGFTVYFEDAGKIFRAAPIAGTQTTTISEAFGHGRAPEVRRATTSLGHTVYRMMYESEDEDGAPVIAFAASFDGLVFTDYAQNPLFSGGEPSNVRLEDRYLLYFVNTGTIALAIDAPAAPSELF